MYILFFSLLFCFELAHGSFHRSIEVHGQNLVEEEVTLQDAGVKQVTNIHSFIHSCLFVEEISAEYYGYRQRCSLKTK